MKLTTFVAAACIAALGGAAFAEDGALKVGMITTLSGGGAGWALTCATASCWRPSWRRRHRSRRRGRPAQARHRRATGRQDDPVRKGRRADRHHLVEPGDGRGARCHGAGQILSVAQRGPFGAGGQGLHPNYFNVAWQNDNLHEAAGAYANDAGYQERLHPGAELSGGQGRADRLQALYEGELAGEVYTQLGQTDYAAEIAQIRASRRRQRLLLPARRHGDFLPQAICRLRAWNCR